MHEHPGRPESAEAAAGTPLGVRADARTLIVVPTYDEAPNVAILRQRVRAAVPGAEMLFIDDASPDGTGARVQEMGRTDPGVRLLSRPRKLGLGTAYLAGFEVGLAEGFDVVVTMDADLSHDPAHLPELLAATGTHDLILGSRYVPGGGVENWGLHRRLLSRGANHAARLVLRLPVHDVTSGFRAYRTEALRSLPLGSIRSSGYSFLEEITVVAARRGLRITEIPIVFCDREGGRSKISAGEIFRAVYHLFRLRVQPPPTSRPVPRPAPDLAAKRFLAGADQPER
ncbi:MAG: polyprenol monophosphomannose synthase [Acidobacteriota bacterium]